MHEEFEGPATPFGPWVDPRVAGPGGCGGAIPEMVWPGSEQELEDAVDQAVAHALFHGASHLDLAGSHLVLDDVWISTHVDFERRTVHLVSHLLHDAGVTVPARVTSRRFLVERRDDEVTATARLSARPFVPLHLGQELIDLVLFSREVHRQLPPGAVPASRSVAHRLLPEWCGTSQAMFESQYAAEPDAHPLYADADW